MEVLNDKTVVANANLKADMERWHKTKQRDVKEILMTLADRQIRYYERVGYVLCYITVESKHTKTNSIMSKRFS